MNTNLINVQWIYISPVTNNTTSTASHYMYFEIKENAQHKVSPKLFQHSLISLKQNPSASNSCETFTFLAIILVQTYASIFPHLVNFVAEVFNAVACNY